MVGTFYRSPEPGIPPYVVEGTRVEKGQILCIIEAMKIMNELESGLRHHSLITNDDERRQYAMLLGLVKQEYEDIVKNEVQRAISADQEAIAQLCAHYIDTIKAYPP